MVKFDPFGNCWFVDDGIEGCDAVAGWRIVYFPESVVGS